MKRFTWILGLVAVLAIAACSDDGQAAVCEPACEAYSPELPGVGECVAGSCTPTLMACFAPAEFSTCRAQCEAVGSVCAQDGCAGGTYFIHSNVDACMGVNHGGVVVSRGCDEAIEWQGNTGAQCCCEQKL